jgi:hemolysin activation/secretion protein
VSPSDEQGHLADRFATPRPVLARSAGLISLPGIVAPENAAGIAVRVSSIEIVGSSIYSSRDLEVLTSALIGQEVPLASIFDLAQRVTAKYGEDGFVLSRAIVPPQELDPADAVVRIEIVEGYIDRVEWPESIDHYRDFFADYAGRITGERPANINTVMRYLLLAGDLPGIDVTSRFQASASNERASTLVVDVTEKPFDAFAQIDNRGTDARGPFQQSVGITVNNLLGLHEAASLSYSGALDLGELHQVSGSWRQVLNAEGLLAFADVSLSWGEPGTAPLQALAFASSGWSADLGLSAPVLRSRDKNLTLSGLVFASESRGEMLGAPSSDDRLRGVRLKADFDVADQFDGITQGNVTISKGIEGLGSSPNGDPLASRENGRVDFLTVAASLSRVQTLGQSVSLLAAIEGQYAFTPLLAPEECGYGGRSFGRAFDPSELSGDSCWSASLELRVDPDIAGNPFETTQFYAFADYGQVFRIAPSPGTPTSENGASAGAGVRLGKDGFTADLMAAKPLFGRTNTDWRAFVTVGARY